MRRVMIKQVPDAEPNADGEWIAATVPNRCCWGGTGQTYPALARYCAPGHHVVQWHWARASRMPRRG